MKIAIVGLGVIGNVHAEVLEELGYKISAVCDIDSTKLQKFTNVEKFNDYDKLIKEFKPDVVHICTPHYLHAEMIIKALKRGINVLCEKPLCIDKKDVARILRAEEKSSAQLGVCFQNRYNPSVVYAKKFLKDKTVTAGVGTLFWNRDKAYYNSASWRGKWKTEGGGVLINQAIHTIDLLQYLIGEPKKLLANVSNNSLKGVIEVEDTAFIKCSSGAEFSLFATNSSKTNFPISISIGTNKGGIEIIANDVYVKGKKIDVGSMDKFYGKSCYGSGHFALIKDYYNCIKKGKKFPIDGKEASKAVKIVLASYRSNGKTINI